jgi:hypothetical protein
VKPSLNLINGSAWDETWDQVWSQVWNKSLLKIDTGLWNQIMDETDSGVEGSFSTTVNVNIKDSL